MTVRDKYFKQMFQTHLMEQWGHGMLLAGNCFAMVGRGSRFQLEHEVMTLDVRLHNSFCLQSWDMGRSRWIIRAFKSLGTHASMD